MKTIYTKAWAIANVCNDLPLTTQLSDPPPWLQIDWDSVRQTVDEVRQYAWEWDLDRSLIVELKVVATEIDRWPEPFTIRGESEAETELRLF